MLQNFLGAHFDICRGGLKDLYGHGIVYRGPIQSLADKLGQKKPKNEDFRRISISVWVKAAREISSIAY